MPTDIGIIKDIKTDKTSPEIINSDLLLMLIYNAQKKKVDSNEI